MAKPRIVRTKPVRGRGGRILHGREVEREMRDRAPLREKCRVCNGTKVVENICAGGKFDTECKFCDEDGYAKVMCGDCGEALPMCRCVRESRYATRS